MRLVALLTKYRPSEGFWLVLSLILLVGAVAVPAAPWTALDPAAFGRFDADR